MTCTCCTTDTVKEEGLLHGAVGLLRAQPLLRLRDRYPGAFAGSVAALMATSRYTGPTAQQAISECFVLTALRMIRPPSLVRAQVRSSRPRVLEWLSAYPVLSCVCVLADPPQPRAP